MITKFLLQPDNGHAAYPATGAMTLAQAVEAGRERVKNHNVTVSVFEIIEAGQPASYLGYIEFNETFVPCEE